MRPGPCMARSRRGLWRRPTGTGHALGVARRAAEPRPGVVEDEQGQPAGDHEADDEGVPAAHPRGDEDVIRSRIARIGRSRGDMGEQEVLEDLMGVHRVPDPAVDQDDRTREPGFQLLRLQL